MSGPGVNVPDVTRDHSGQDLPLPHQLHSCNFSCRRCPFCGGAVAAGVWPPAPFMISATPSAADRSTCIFLLHTSLFGLSSLLSCRSVRPRPAQEPVHPPGTTPAVRLVIEDDMPYRMASWHLSRDHRVFVLGPPSRIGSRPRGKKSRAVVDTVYLERQ